MACSGEVIDEPVGEVFEVKGEVGGQNGWKGRIGGTSVRHSSLILFVSYSVWIVNVFH